MSRITTNKINLRLGGEREVLKQKNAALHIKRETRILIRMQLIITKIN